jgi:hypothetical protein
VAVSLEPGSPRYWLQRLGTQLENELPSFETLHQYRIGDHPLPEGHQRAKSAFRNLQRKARSNYTGLVIESVKERMTPTGFRTGGEGSVASDKDARMMWQANSLDAECGIVHDNALTFGRSYVIVGPPDQVTGQPVITAEDPRQVTHVPDAIRRRVVRAALKLYEDDETGKCYAVIYLADTIHYFVRPKPRRNAYKGRFDQAKWTEDDSVFDGGFAENQIGIVPVVPFINRAAVNPMGMGEFEDVLDIQDRINNVILDRLVIAKMQAYRQRWAKGLELEDENGNPIESFDPGADLLWAVGDENVEFGEFESTDIRPLLDAAKADTNDLAAITRTPPHYLLGAMVNLSGDALKAAETGLISKVKDRMVEFGESWEQVNRIGSIYMGREIPLDSEIIWSDPESRSMAELADAAVKKQSVGVPWEQLMIDLNYTPPEIERMRPQRAADALLTVVGQPPTVTNG